MIKDENCDNIINKSADIERIVENHFMRLSYLGNEEIRKVLSAIDPLDTLQKELANAKRQLSRLYDFEDEDESDDVLRKKILDVKKRIASLSAQIQSKEEKAIITKSVNKASDPEEPQIHLAANE